jgi:phenylpyruvate tautomerase
MPVVRITVSQVVYEEKRRKVMRDLTQKLIALTGKPEKYMMVVFQPPAEIFFGSSDAASALIEVKSIGALEPERTKKISQDFCAYFQSELGIPEDRVYIEFTDVKPSMFGWNGKTFA